ncbi:MAG: ABC transporter permease [Clostridia bacterium]|nr:ABC transporter permease [Clostridia bacterium]
MKGVYVPAGWALNFYEQLADFEDLKERALYTDQFNGFADITAAELEGLGYAVAAGRLPDGKRDEIAVSAYMADAIIASDYLDKDGNKVKVENREQVVGKVLYLNGTPFTVTGVVDTGFDLSRYQPLTEDYDNLTTAQQLVRFALEQELHYAKNYSLHTTAFTGEGYVAARVAAAYPVQSLDTTYLMLSDEEYMYSLDPYYIGTLQDVRDSRVVWLDGKQRTALGEKELVISLDMLEEWAGTLPYEDEEALFAAVKELVAKMGPLQEESERRWQDDAERWENYTGYTVVGYLDPATLDKGLATTLITAPSMKEDIVPKDEGHYSFAIGAMPTDPSEVKRLVSYAYNEGDVRYELRNAVTYELDTIHEMLVVLADVFLWIGVGFAVFAALMLANFISVSITFKKQEIGILRAIGSRSNDVFRIFFSESFIIAMVNFLLSAVGVGAATAIINGALRSQLNILLTVLHFGVRQIGLLLIVSLLVAAVASYFPVRRIASKRPIDAIRNR